MTVSNVPERVSTFHIHGEGVARECRGLDRLTQTPQTDPQ